MMVLAISIMRATSFFNLCQRRPSSSRPSLSAPLLGSLSARWLATTGMHLTQRSWFSSGLPIGLSKLEKGELKRTWPKIHSVCNQLCVCVCVTSQQQVSKLDTQTTKLALNFGSPHDGHRELLTPDRWPIQCRFGAPLGHYHRASLPRPRTRSSSFTVTQCRRLGNKFFSFGLIEKREFRSVD